MIWKDYGIANSAMGLRLKLAEETFTRLRNISHPNGKIGYKATSPKLKGSQVLLQTDAVEGNHEGWVGSQSDIRWSGRWQSGFQI